LRAGKIEGYLSLPVVVLTFCNPLLDWLPEDFGAPIWIGIWACGWLLAISGVRHGEGSSRVVAGISLAILVIQASLFLLIALH
jgi:hypothetical protein